MGGRRFAPRSEPLCFPTHLTPMSYRRPWGGWQTPTKPVCVPGDRDGGPTPRVPDTGQAWVPLWKALGRKCQTPPTSTEPSRTISCKQCGNNPAALEPAQDDSLDITVRLSLRSPAPNVKASPGRKLGQKGQGKHRPRQGRDQWRDECGRPPRRHRPLTTPSLI